MSPPAISQYLTPSGVYDSDSSENEDAAFDNRDDENVQMTKSIGVAVNATATLANDTPQSTKSDSSSGGVIVVKPRLSVPAVPPRATPRVSPASSSDSERHYIEIRVGPRTTADEQLDIPTYCIIVARIDPVRGTVTWLGVDTWILNGLRIGEVDLADSFRDTEKLELTTEFDVDPFFAARDVLTADRVRAFLLNFVKNWDGSTETEQLDPSVAWDLRCMAVQNRMLVDSHGFDGDNEAEDPRNHFRAPWDVPVQPELAELHFPTGLEDFLSRRGAGEHMDELHVVATFFNDLDIDEALGLPHHVHLSLHPDETSQQVRAYFLDGEGGFAGLTQNRVLRKILWKWALELWVLPQIRGCKLLYRWDDVPFLCASGFIAQKSMCADGDEKAKLYIEARIVEKVP
nr:hypothetical protein B0A51_16071 [Rachicladosporium sp. CCFEE 5018]